MFSRLHKKLFLFIIILIFLISCKSTLKPKIHKKADPHNAYNKVTGEPEYWLHQNIKTTYFYIGEYKKTGQVFIDNRSSAWTGDWVKAYGATDHPHKRDGCFPEGFLPGENPFYCALPYNDLTRNSYKENIDEFIPWIEEVHDERTWPYSYCKNQWIRIIYNDRACYAQWEDVGPFETNNWQYVFGRERPLNKLNGGVGLDLSPACWHYLGMRDNGFTCWQFVDFEDIPDGPWKRVITTSQPCW